MTRWFLPEVPDVIGLLSEQAAITVRGLEAFEHWSGGDATYADAVNKAEHAADRCRRQLQAALRAAFSTPVDPEDLYELSERLDAVLNAAKNAIREADLMGLSPDEVLGPIAVQVTIAARHLAAAFAVLKSDPEQATTEADLAIKCQREIERLYRAAMSRLLEVEDLRVVITWREMYRRYARIGDGLVSVAERVWYAVVKEG